MLARAARRLRTKCIFKNVHPQNSNHLRPHSRTITTLDHSRFGLGNKFSGKQIRPNLLRSTSLLYKILPTNLGVCKSNFYTFYTSHLSWNSAILIIQTPDRMQYFTIFSRLIYTKKLLDSYWLRKECSSSVTRVQITNGFWLDENTKETTKNQSD